MRRWEQWVGSVGLGARPVGGQRRSLSSASGRRGLSHAWAVKVTFAHAHVRALLTVNVTPLCAPKLFLTRELHTSVRAQDGAQRAYPPPSAAPPGARACSWQRHKPAQQRAHLLPRVPLHVPAGPAARPGAEDQEGAAAVAADAEHAEHGAQHLWVSCAGVRRCAAGTLGSTHPWEHTWAWAPTPPHILRGRSALHGFRQGGCLLGHGGPFDQAWPSPQPMIP